MALLSPEIRSGEIHLERILAMCQYTLKLNLVLAVSLALFYTSVEIQAFSVYSYEEMQRHAHFIKHPFSVLSVPSKILSSSVSMTSLDCAFNCLQTSSCVSFNFGISSKLCQLLATDKYDSPEMFESSQEFDHHSYMTPCINQPCKAGACQPIYASNDYFCKSPVILYYMAAPTQNCDHLCESLRLRCVKSGGFPTGNAVHIFNQLGFQCATTSSYYYGDNPGYLPKNGKCGGAVNIPNEIKCERGHNPSVRRLCPCQ